MIRRDMPVSGDKVRQMRERAGLSKSEAASRLGMRLPNYLRIETGGSPNLTAGSLIALADLFKCSLDDLVDRPSGKAKK